LNSFPLLTYAVGLVFANHIGERYGRRPIYIAMQFLCLIGLVVTYTSKTFGQILAGRCLVQSYIGMQEWLIPMLQAEIVPGAIRGAFVITFPLAHQFGAFILSIITNFTNKYPDNSAWQIPVAVMLAFPCINILCNFVIPESPRWLLRQHRFDDAVDNLHWLYGCSPDYSAAEDARLIQESFEEHERIATGSWLDLFRGTNARRTAIACGVATFSMLSGNAFASLYGTIFLAEVGSALDPFTGTMIKKAVVILGPITGILLVERLGRRRIYLIWGTLTAASLFTMGSLGAARPDDEQYKLGIVAMSIVFPYFRITSFGAMATVLPVEVSHVSLREKTAFAAWLVQDIWDFVTAFTLPYLLDEEYANLQAKVGFIYASLAVVGLVWGYLFLPDLTGRSLEEVDEMFEQKVSAWKTTRWVNTDPNSIGVRVTQLENRTAGVKHARGEDVDKLGEVVDHGGVDTN
jgi:MFS transporter, SP family, sugar:H+ symporter